MKDQSVHSSESRTSISLLEEAKARSPQAWDRLESLYRPLIAYWCRQRSVNDTDALDVAQEVFAAVYQYLPKFVHRGQHASFRAWLKQITWNVITDCHRKDGLIARTGGTSAHRWLQEVAAGNVADESDYAQLSVELRVLYGQALELVHGTFSERDNEIFRRVVQNGERSKDVAQDLHIPANVVYIAVTRIKKRLRDSFQGTIGA